MDSSLSRRRFLAQGAGSLSAVWVSAHWPSLLAAAEHARRAALSTAPPRFEFLRPEDAREIEAVTARIIPTTDTPGAREAGVIYFIDRALTTFDDQKTYRAGLPDLQARVSEMFSGVSKFSALTPEQQDEVLHSLDDHQTQQRQSGLRPRLTAGNFFETLRQHTIMGFLIDPDYSGNHDGAGWKVIGREREHMFQPPFGYYDKGYPGWEPEMKEAEKK